MNSEKEIAEVVERCYEGKASEEDLVSLLERLLELTTLGKNIKGNVPGLVFNIRNEGFVSEDTRGQYSGTDQKVYMDENLISDTMKGADRALFHFLETYGHEVTHHNQKLNGEFNQNTSFSVTDIRLMFEAVGVPVGDTIRETIRVGSYLRQHHEEDARAGGILFLRESFENLINNQYIKTSVKEKIKNDLNYMEQHIKEQKEVERTNYEAYDKFIVFFKERNIQHFMNGKGASGFDSGEPTPFKEAFKIWLRENNPSTVTDGYIKLVGSEDKYNILRNEITKYIMDESFSKECRDKLTNLLCEVLKDPRVEKQFYDSRLTDIFSKGQILEVYDRLLKNDVSKIGGELFKKCAGLSEYYEDMAKILANNLENITLNSGEDVSALSNNILYVLWGPNKKIDVEIENKLSKALNSLQKINFEQNNQEEKKTVR